MFKSNLFLALFSFVLITAVWSCHCDDDDDNGPCPDLIVQSIDDIGVSCPGGGGTCVTTVTFTLANIGPGNSGGFNVRIVLDPSAGVVVNHFVAGGLAAGDVLPVTIMSPPGGNCFDPNCTVTVTADSNNAVSECDENNNELSRTDIG